MDDAHVGLRTGSRPVPLPFVWGRRVYARAGLGLSYAAAMRAQATMLLDRAGQETDFFPFI